jgi:hypothetical protein
MTTKGDSVMSKYTKKEQLKDFEFSLRQTLYNAQRQSNSAYPTELSKFIEPLQELNRELGPILEKYFRKDWDKEETA